MGDRRDNEDGDEPFPSPPPVRQLTNPRCDPGPGSIVVVVMTVMPPLALPAFAAFMAFVLPSFSCFGLFPPAPLLPTLMSEPGRPPILIIISRCIIIVVIIAAPAIIGADRKPEALGRCRARENCTGCRSGQEGRQKQFAVHVHSPFETHSLEEFPGRGRAPKPRRQQRLPLRSIARPASAPPPAPSKVPRVRSPWPAMPLPSRPPASAPTIAPVEPSL